MKQTFITTSQFLRQVLMLVPLIFTLALFPSSHTQAQSSSSKHIRILVLGDSLSAAYGLSSGEGWVDLMTQKLKQEKYSAKVINASISGDTTAGGLTRLPALLAKHQPSHVIIELGGNDGLRGTPVVSAKANLQKMTDLCRAAGARVLLIGMQMPPNFGLNYTQSFAAMYIEIAKQSNAALVPFFLEEIATDLSQFQADRIHPTAAAQSKLLNTVWSVLAPWLKLK